MTTRYLSEKSVVVEAGAPEERKMLYKAMQVLSKYPLGVFDVVYHYAEMVDGGAKETSRLVFSVKRLLK